jgi:hypothetical protein
MQQHADVVTDLKGNVIRAAQVRVLLLDGTLATIYAANGGAPTVNPLRSGARGEFAFYAPNGDYTLEISVEGRVFGTLGPIKLYDALEDADRASWSLLGAADGAGKIRFGARSVADKFADVLTIKDSPFNAKGSGDDTAAVIALNNYVNAITLTSHPVEIVLPPGVYTSSVGFDFRRPVMLSARGALFNYTGTGKAVTLGPDGVTGWDVFTQGEYSVDGLRLTGGANATHGIYVNDYILEPRIRDVTFFDFGNENSHGIFTQFQVWDIIIEGCRMFALNRAVHYCHRIQDGWQRLRWRQFAHHHS